MFGRLEGLRRRAAGRAAARDERRAVRAARHAEGEKYSAERRAGQLEAEARHYSNLHEGNVGGGNVGGGMGGGS
jgi:hypothetical protein